MKRLAIIGASGHGMVVADAAELAGWEHIDFFDDAWPQKESNGIWNVQGSVAALCDLLKNYDGVVVAVGNNSNREQLQIRLRDAGASIVTIIHPSVVVSPHARVGAGCVIFAGAVVNAGGVVGDGVILNTACSVDHDCVLADYVHVSPGAHLAGNVDVGTRSWIGIGANVRQGVKVGSDAIVGAGAAVVTDVGHGQCVVGVPARPMAEKT